MEQSAGYRNVEAKIRIFEEQLASCDLAINECDQSGREAGQKIEDHFSQCLNALAARKDTLLREVAQRVNNQRQKVEASRATLVSSIDACRNTLRSATLVYSIDPNSAEGLFQVLMRMPVLNIVPMKINTKLQDAILNTIQTHGEVVGDTNSSYYTRADMVTTFAGSVEGNEDGQGQNAKVNTPWGICFNPNDNCLYFTCRASNTIKKLTLQGHTSTFVSGNSLNYPTGIAINNKENAFYVVNQGAYTICRINSAGTVSVLAGNGQAGNADGTGTRASFNYSVGIAIDQQTGNIYVGDQSNHSIRKISPQGVVITLAGSTVGCVDGNGVSAKFNHPFGVCFDENDKSLLVCDRGNDRLRRVSANGKVTTLCVIPTPYFATMTQNGTVLVTTGHENIIYKVTASQGNYRADVIAGTGRSERVDGKLEECSMSYPLGIVVHEESHSCFVAEVSGTIRKISFVNPI